MGSWGVGQHGVEDMVRKPRSAVLQPRPDDAQRLGVGRHRATSRERRPSIGVERRAQPAHRVMESGSDGAGGDAEGVGDLVQRQAQVLVQHEDAR